jgi:hypothetical protein
VSFVCGAWRALRLEALAWEPGHLQGTLGNLQASDQNGRGWGSLDPTLDK